ncbi:MAG TPA: hypothetical protein VE378_01045 [Nitrososphaeraceae archaeon]|nr:hypothetical protein [Nitrososphaeraceae archaeon]
MIVRAAFVDIIFFSLLLLSIPSTLLPFIVVEVHGQKVLKLTSANNSSGFSIYKNQEYRFEISYPSNWQKIEFTEGIERNERKIVANFLSLPEGSSDKFRDYVIVEVSDFQPTHQLSNYVNHQIDNYIKLLDGFRLIESPSSLPDISGNRSDSKQGGVSPNSKIVFTYDDPLAGTIKIMELYFQNKDKVYILSLHSEIRSYDNYLTIIQRMVDSFRII